nr:MAG: putative coat protein [Tombusviridae sp.]
MNQLTLTYPGYTEPPEDSYTSNLRRGALEYPTQDPAVGFARAEESAIQTIRDIDVAVSRAENAAVSWLSQQLQRGAVIIGNAVYDAAGRLLDKVPNKIISIVEDQMAKPKQGRKMAKVAKTQPRKGPQPSKVIPVFGRAPIVSAPVNISRRVNVKSKPRITAGAKGIVISHREMIGQIISSANSGEYSTSAFVINPGKYGTFPWLSSLAGNFDKYIMRRLRFSTISNQATSTAGRVGLGFDVDSTDPSPADRNEFFSLTYHAECAPWDSTALDIPVDGKERFVNSHTTSDSKLIDIGQLILMSDAITAQSTNLSDVIVEYVVELIDPQQAIYSTQLILANNPSVATLDLLPTFGPAVSQLAGVGFTNPSTSTNLFLKLLQGYYHISAYFNDTAGGTPVVSLAVQGGTGRVTGSSTTTERMLVGICKITTNDGYLRFATSGVAPVNLDDITITMTRISAAIYVKMIAGSSYDTTMAII